MPELTIKEAIDSYIRNIATDKSPRTVSTYKRGMSLFVASLRKRDVDINSVKTSRVFEGWIADFLVDAQKLAPSTQRIYYSSVSGWYKFLINEELALISIEKLQKFAAPYLQRENNYFPPPSPSVHDISLVIDYIIKLCSVSGVRTRTSLPLLRDRAIILTLVDTGIEVETICDLRRGHVVENEKRFVVPNSDKPFVNFTRRVAIALDEYLNARSFLDNEYKDRLSLPLFARHDRRISKKVEALSPRTVQNIVKGRAYEALGDDYHKTVTPKDLRRYFENTTSLSKQLDLFHPKIVRECKSQYENGEYDDAILNAMKVIEVEVRSKASLNPTDIGVPLINKTMGSNSPTIKFSTVSAEQEAARSLYSAAIGSFKNPRSHRFVGTSDPIMAFECLSLASLLMRMLEEAVV